MSRDRARDAGEYLTNWLEVNPDAHLVVISTTEVTQLGIRKESKRSTSTRFETPQTQLGIWEAICHRAC